MTGQDLPAAVLWDMDGTLVDSEPAWIGAEVELVEAFGGTWTAADGAALVGSDMAVTAAALRSRGVDLRQEEIGRRLTTAVVASVRTSPVWRPGARELLAELAARGVPAALVTSSPRIVADAVLGLLGPSAFATSFALEDVRCPKPDPEPYRRAAAALDVPVRRCVAIEDSPSGVRSAVAAGAATIGVPNVVPLPDELGATTWSTLAGRGVDDLAVVLTATRSVTRRA